MWPGLAGGVKYRSENGRSPNKRTATVKKCAAASHGGCVDEYLTLRTLIVGASGVTDIEWPELTLAGTIKDGKRTTNGEDFCGRNSDGGESLIAKTILELCLATSDFLCG